VTASRTDAPAGPTLADLREAAAGLAGVAVRTSVVDAPFLAGAAGVPVALKCEFEQPMGAFKARGAYTALRRMDPTARSRGVITYSSGNHGQAVAWAARMFGVRAVVVMPETAPRIKVEGVKGFGGEVVLAPPASPARKAMAEEIAAREGLVIVPPFDHPDIIAGQGTCGLEILEQRPDVAAILVPVGGGGLLAGICAAVEAVRPGVEVVAVEPEGAAKLTAAWAAGHPVALERTGSVADGLLPLSIGSLTFPIIRRVVRRVVTVADADIRRAVRAIHAGLGLRVEPSGAATAAAVLAGLALPGPTVCVVSGGNVDEALFRELTA
jgi:threonine dehydratase